MSHVVDDLEENHARMLRGELYYAFTEDLAAARTRGQAACKAYNQAYGNVSRREEIKLLQETINIDGAVTPEKLANPDEDAKQFHQHPIVLPPFTADYGKHTTIGMNTFINFNCLVLDTCHVKIGSRCLLGPNISLFAATHPLDPEVRDGLNGPEAGDLPLTSKRRADCPQGKQITIADDCWIAGNVIIYANIGQGCTIGAGSVVTKDVPPYSFAAGNPARVIRRIDCPAARRFYGDKFDENTPKTVSGRATDAEIIAKA